MEEASPEARVLRAVVLHLQPIPARQRSVSPTPSSPYIETHSVYENAYSWNSAMSTISAVVTSAFSPSLTLVAVLFPRVSLGISRGVDRETDQ